MRRGRMDGRGPADLHAHIGLLEPLAVAAVAGAGPQGQGAAAFAGIGEAAAFEAVVGVAGAGAAVPIAAVMPRRERGVLAVQPAQDV